MAKTDLCLIAYVSAAVEPLPHDALMSMLQTARRRNASRGITGLLLHHDGGFMQALEGPRHAVEALLDRIRRDPRHRGLIVVLNESRQVRSFGDWAMAFAEPSCIPMPPGFSAVFTDERVREAYVAHPERIHRLLGHYARAQASRRGSTTDDTLVAKMSAPEAGLERRQ